MRAAAVWALTKESRSERRFTSPSTHTPWPQASSLPWYGVVRSWRRVAVRPRTRGEGWVRRGTVEEMAPHSRPWVGDTVKHQWRVASNNSCGGGGVLYTNRNIISLLIHNCDKKWLGIIECSHDIVVQRSWFTIHTTCCWKHFVSGSDRNLRCIVRGSSWDDWLICIYTWLPWAPCCPPAPVSQHREPPVQHPPHPVPLVIIMIISNERRGVYGWTYQQ